MWERIGRRAGVGLTVALAAGAAAAQVATEPGRGELLYATHCIACHTVQVHWRDRRSVTDWPSLKDQVRHWQAAARLGWTDADVVAVARHLNETVYRLPQTADVVGSLSPARRGSHAGEPWR